MVVLKEKKSNLDASWNTRGDKFLIGTSSGYVYQCTYNMQFGFWVAGDSKPRHKDSVLKVRYDPGSGHASASCSLDGTIQIKSCFHPEFDSVETASGPFANVTTDGETIFKYNPGAWINTVAFSPDSCHFVFSTHDSELHFGDISEAEVAAKKVKCSVVPIGGLPQVTGGFINNETYIGSGYDKAPMVYKLKGGAWQKEGTLDAGVNKE